MSAQASNAKASNPDPAEAFPPSATEIGVIPPTPNSAERGEAANNLPAFVARYFPDRAAPQPWLDQLARAIYNQNPDLPQVSPADPDAGLFDAAILWALLTGRRRAVLIRGDRPAGIALIRSIRDALVDNELLAADWPQASIPIRHAIEHGNGGKGQTYRGRATNAEAVDERLRLADLHEARVVGMPGHVPGAFVCTQFYAPNYDLQLLTPPAVAAT